ncbi:MAG: hypothetical protein ACKO16_16510 [Gemmataceae bacterium]
MWTPKRILILGFGFSLFLALYFVYAWFLGAIDGIPPLPPAFSARAKEDLPPLPVRPTSRVVTKLQQAFGLDCPEVQRKIKIELNSRNMLFAADSFQIEPDGRVRLLPLSVVVFNRDKNENRTLEINTIRGEVAYLKFDRPIVNLTDIGNRKIVGGEISGKIEIINNRKTPSRDDDLFIFIPNGPLFYQESKQLIWTTDIIHLTDNHSKPRPTEIHGQGMEMELLTEASLPTPAQTKKSKGDNILGVKKVKLLSQVDMHLYVDNDSSFLGATPEKGKPEKATGTPREKAHIGIKTLGTFDYLIQKGRDIATFDACISPGTPKRDVIVTRHHEGKGLIDQLVCEKLEINLKRKESVGPSSGIQNEEKSFNSGIDIENALATGKEVVLISEEEKLEAHGNSFFYDAKTSTATLKGSPEMWAVKEGNILHAVDMTIQNEKADPKNPTAKSFQKATARGPGWINITEKDKNIKGKPVRATWKEQLVSTREGNLDLLILTGEAKFDDPVHDQNLHADTLKVWLKASELKKQNTTSPLDGKEQNPQSTTNPTGSGKKLHRVEAIGNVSADSKEVIIRDSGRLSAWFKEVAPKNALTVGTSASPINNGPKPAIASQTTTNQTTPPISVIPNMGIKIDANNNDNIKKNPNTPRPIHLSARSIEAWVDQIENKNKLERLWTEGSVTVKQDSEKPGEKGVDIKGDTLQMTAHPDGNFLVVTGDLAQLRMDRMLIVGPEVNIDQATNKAWVNGVGAMQMESTTNFQGTKLNKPVPMEVHWNKSMFFNGKFAEFHGGIQAEQENSRLACQSLQVFFDKAVSLKAGNKPEQPARVQNLVCDRSVRVEEIIREDDKIIKYHRIQSITLSMNKLDKDDLDGKDGPDGNEVRASGPGEVRIMQRSGADISLTPISPEKQNTPDIKANEKGSEDEMKLTQVSFLRSMYGNSKRNTATFLENVRVLNFPSENPTIEIDLESVMDHLPKGGIYLRCDRLDVLSKQGKNKSQQEMIAKGRVIVQAQEFWGRAEQVSYEEAKNLVIFYGGENGLATLYKKTRQGVPPEEIKGKKITYNRLSGQFKIDEGRWLNNGAN